jgi:hypothetical protein
MKRTELIRRQRIARHMKRQWRDAAFRQHRSRALLRKWREPAFRRAHSEATTRQWAKPGMRARLQRAMRRPWRDPAHVRRMSRISKARWRDPRYRPILLANARRNLGPSPGALRLHALLGAGWILECWTPHGPIDIAHPGLKLAIEVDDLGHRRRKQQRRDRQKERALRGLGWAVFRVSEAGAKEVA